LQKYIIVKSVLNNLSYIYQKYSCQAKYPSGYTVSGPYRISGIRLLDWPDIQPAGYPAKTVSGASLIAAYLLGWTDGGIVVEDCLRLLLNLLRNNPSNQTFFKEGNYISRLLMALSDSGSSRSPIRPSLRRGTTSVGCSWLSVIQVAVDHQSDLL
jgi:hypothetical protein